MIKATASSEAVSVSIRKSGLTRRRIAKSARRRAQNNLVRWSFRESAHAEGYRKADAENVYDDADDHELAGKRTLGGRGQWHDAAVLEAINSYAVKGAWNVCVLGQDKN